MACKAESPRYLDENAIFDEASSSFTSATCGQSIASYVQVSMKGDLYNFYTDSEGEQQTSLLGNVQDLRSIKVKEIAGIPIEKLQAHYDIQRNRAGKKDAGMPDRMIGFPDQTPVPLPPGTVNVYKVHMPHDDTTSQVECTVSRHGC